MPNKTGEPKELLAAILSFLEQEVRGILHRHTEALQESAIDHEITDEREASIDEQIGLIDAIQEDVEGMFTAVRAAEGSSPTKTALEWLLGVDHVAVLLPRDLWDALQSEAYAQGSSAHIMVSRAIVQLLGKVIYDREKDGEMGTA
jgi:hypothetical protein